MKPLIPSALLLIVVVITGSCHRKYYENTFFDDQTRHHKIVAVIPPEMVFTGKQPKDMTAEQVSNLEETESRKFMASLYSSILRYANTSHYYMRVNLLDMTKTLQVLEENNISVRDSWRKDDIELCKLLNVDAIVRMQVTKKRYMSDAASYTVNVARNILIDAGATRRMPIPNNVSKTNDVQAYCSLVSNNITLWNESYRATTDWSRPVDEIVYGVTNGFGVDFPYKVRR